ncbi:MAG: P-loop ATPase, Sll1717 family [Phycisphaeraceae bacterium]
MSRKPSFWNVDWGKDDAKSDLKLENYFVKLPEYASVVDGSKRYIIGRKGTGKTAVAQHIFLQAKSNPLIFARKLSLRNFPLQDLRSLRDRGMRDKAQFVPIWKFLLLTEFARLAAEDHGAIGYEELTELNEFLDSNFGKSAMTFFETVKVLRQNDAKVAIKAGMLSAEGKKHQSAESIVHVHYERITDYLTKLLRSISTESRYYIFLDELDEGYSAGDHNLRLLLLALLRAVEDIAIDLGSYNSAYLPIALLRSDIFDRLEDNDLNKLDDYVVRLEWTGRAGARHSLQEVANERIKASIEMPSSGNPWDFVAINKSIQYPPTVKSLWNFLYNRTFDRPRDILKFLKVCQKVEGRGRLKLYQAEDAEPSYSDWLHNELRDEMQSHFPPWREAIQCVRRVGRGKFQYSELRKALEKDSTIIEWMGKFNKNADDAARMLFDFSVIGNLSHTRTWLFRYKDHDLEFNPNQQIIVHYGIQKKLKMGRRHTRGQ